MIRVNRAIALDENEIQLDFIRASGPGGQNVNKVATSVHLRFDVAKSPSLPEEVRQRLLSLARKQITKEGVLIIEARRFRTQAANRQDALERLVALLRRSAQKPKIRRKTRPTQASQTRRLDAKRRRVRTKSLRRAITENSE